MESQNSKPKEDHNPKDGSQSDRTMTTSQSAGSRHLHKHTRILMMNFKLIEDNLQFNQGFYDTMKLLRVLPPSMIKDIEKTPIQKKVEVLITLLGKLGQREFNKFCDALDLYGDAFLGQHLREQAFTDFHERNELHKVIQEQYPQLRRVFTPVEMTAFATHLQDRLNELVARNMWKLQSNEKRRLTSERKEILGNDILMYNRLTKWEEKVNDLKTELQAKEKDLKEVKKQFTETTHCLITSRTKHAEEQSKLIQSNEASERTIEYTQERLMIFDQEIKKLNVRILQLLMPERLNSFKNDPENVRVSRLAANLDRLLCHIEKVEKALRSQLKKRKNERKRFFDTLCIEDNQQDISTAFHQCLTDIHKGLQPLHRQINSVLHIIDEKDVLSKRKDQTAIDYLTTTEYCTKPGFDTSKAKTRNIVQQIDDITMKTKNAAEKLRALKISHFQKSADLEVIKKEMKAIQMNKNLLNHNNTSFKSTDIAESRQRYKSPIPAIKSVKVTEMEHEDESKVPIQRVVTPYASHIRSDNTSSSVSFSSEVAIITESGSKDNELDMTSRSAKTERKKSNGLSAWVPDSVDDKSVNKPTSSNNRKYSIITRSGILNSPDIHVLRKVSQASVVSVSSDNPEKGFRKISGALSSSS